VHVHPGTFWGITDLLSPPACAHLAGVYRPSEKNRGPASRASEPAHSTTHFLHDGPAHRSTESLFFSVLPRNRPQNNSHMTPKRLRAFDSWAPFSGFFFTGQQKHRGSNQSLLEEALQARLTAIEKERSRSLSESTRQITPRTRNGHAPPSKESRKSCQSVNHRCVLTW